MRSEYEKKVIYVPFMGAHVYSINKKSYLRKN